LGIFVVIGDMFSDRDNKLVLLIQKIRIIINREGGYNLYRNCPQGFWG